jgi:hypothetical protein
MRAITSLLVVSLLLLAGPATAKATAGSDKMKTCAASWNAMSADQKKATTYKDYSKSCLSGGAKAAPAAAPAMAPAATPMMAAKPAKPAKAAAAPAMAPASGAAPAGATGLCKDGTYTMSKTHSGSCSHHGGVAKWL